MISLVCVALSALSAASSANSLGLKGPEVKEFTASALGPALAQEGDESEEDGPPKWIGLAWKGGVSAGMTLQRGNTNSQTSSLAAEAEGNGDQNRMAVSLAYIGGRTENRDPTDANFRDTTTTARQFIGDAKYDEFLTEDRKTYLYGKAIALTDGVRELNLLWSLGAGAGYQFWDAEKKQFFGMKDREQSFRAEAGLGYTKENYKGTVSDEDYVSGRIAVRYDVSISDSATAYTEVEWLPSLEDFTQDQLYRTKSGLRTNISGNLNAELTVLFNYDASPAVGFGRRDTTYIFGLNWSF